MMTRMNFSSTKVCGSCKYWNDPTYSAIKPTLSKDIWEVDLSVKCLCVKKRIIIGSGHRCSDYQSKLQ